MSKKLPIVAIVGRANVGKSSLFNSVLRRREAIVANEAGTTRDSVYAKAAWKDHEFWIVDTAGMKDPTDDFEFTIQEQILQATDSADVIWVVIEADVPFTEEDRRVAKLALKSKKPVFLVVNKADKAPKAQTSAYQRLGIKPIILTAATQNRGTSNLLDAVVANLPKAQQREDEDRIRVALLGRPNVGKSHLFNTLAKKQQAIVADVAGTTRDINRTIVRYQGREVEIMDTAGIRRNGKIERGIEKFSVIRSLSAIEQADVCLLLMDVNELNVQLDQKIAGMIKEAGKGLVLVVSKWDSLPSLVEAQEKAPKAHVIENEKPVRKNKKTSSNLTREEKRALVGTVNYHHSGSIQKDPYTRDSLAAQIQNNFVFVPWAPLVFTSAVSGQNVTKLFDMVLDIMQQRSKAITTGELNRWLRDAVDEHPPAGLKNSNPKLNYIVHEDDNPIPSFKVFGAHTKLLHWSYKRYLERKMREQYGYEGTPIQFWFIEKH